MPKSGRIGDSVTVLLAACSATIAVISVTFSSALGGTANAASRPEIVTPKHASLPFVQQMRTVVNNSTAPFWRDPSNPAARAGAATTDSARASALARIAGQPTATWLTNSSAASTVHRVVAAAAATHATPVFVAYYLPGRDCGGYSSGGAGSSAQYLSWLSAISAQLGSSPAVVVVEPDAVAMAVSRTCSAAGGWRSLLTSAVTTFKRDRNATVYLDAGHPGWVGNLTSLATELRASGIGSANGFALNVSNFHTVAENNRYGTSLVAKLPGSHYVIDTSRSGAGALPAGSGYAGPSWCNPPGRALGPNPTTSTGLASVDAYLWVKYPGASDGSCGLGDPSAGVFWPAYAIGLAGGG